MRSIVDARVCAVCLNHVDRVGAESSTLADARVSAVYNSNNRTLADARVSAVEILTGLIS